MAHEVEKTDEKTDDKFPVYVEPASVAVTLETGKISRRTIKGVRRLAF